MAREAAKRELPVFCGVAMGPSEDITGLAFAAGFRFIKLPRSRAEPFDHVVGVAEGPRKTEIMPVVVARGRVAQKLFAGLR